MSEYTTDTHIEALEAAVADRRPELARIIEEHGDSRLADYMGSLAGRDAQLDMEPIQPSSDFHDLLAEQAETILGSDVSAQVRQRLEEDPSLVTANHHAPDYFPVTAQGNIAAALREPADGIVPIAADSTVPLNNVVYPRGLQLTREGEDGVPFRLPIFSKKYKQAAVGSVPAFDRDMVARARARIDGFYGQRHFGKAERDAMIRVLEDIYMSDDVLAQGDYAQQVTAINHQLWQMMFQPEVRDQLADVAYLDMERAGRELLAADIRNDASLMSQVMFDPALRASVLRELDGVPLCWDESGEGTHFLWAVDKKGRTTSMQLSQDGSQLESDVLMLDMDPESIAQALEEEVVIPAGFVEFGTTAFARGQVCYGGFMQVQYLTDMRRGLTRALATTGREDWADRVAAVPTENYSAGMTVAVVEYEDGSIQPAGGLEMIAAGGLSLDNLETMSNMTVREANLLGLPGMYSIIYGQGERDPNLSAISQQDVLQHLGDKVVRIEL